MKKISWLHLSDLHLGRDIYNEEKSRKKLLQDIKEQIAQNNIQLDLIFITGDLTYSGQEKEFNHVQKFIDELLTVTGLKKDDIIVVPGNHDINYIDVSSTSSKFQKLFSNENNISGITENDAKIEFLMQPLKNYREFLRRNFSWAEKKDTALSYTINKVIKGISVSVLALNTAWMEYGDGNAKNKILIGEKQVREAFDAANNPQITIVLMHHPLEWFDIFELDDVKKMLERRTDFILNGHIHRAEVIGKGSIFGKAFKISAGSTYESENHMNSYNIVSSDISKGIAECFFRRFNEEIDEWSEDNTMDGSVSDGKIRVRLSDRIVTDSMGNRAQKDLWINPSDCNEKIDIPDIPRDLINRIKEGKCILFAGAGTSLDAGLPSWYDLLKSMIDQVDSYGGLDGNQKKELNLLMRQHCFSIVAEFCKEKLGKRGFADFIQEKLDTRHKVSLTHNLLAEIPFKGAITSNYDDFIEKAHKNCQIILPEDINKLDQGTMTFLFKKETFPVFKIHGSYKDPESIILTDYDYRNIIFRKTQYRENLRQLFSDKSLLFIGFSFEDSNINLLLQEIFTVTEGMANSHYAFINDIGNIKKEFFWKSRNIRVILYQTIDGSHFVLGKMLEKMKDEFK